MRQLTFKGFLTQYVQELSSEHSKQQAGNVLADVFYREKGKKQA